jgi:prevent-host-death family protein
MPKREGTMQNTVAEVQSLSHFKKHTGDVLAHLKETGDPVVLTVHGKEEVVVQDAEAYRRLREQAERAEMMEFLKESKADMDAGRVLPALEFMESLRQTP